MTESLHKLCHNQSVCALQTTDSRRAVLQGCSCRRRGSPSICMGRQGCSPTWCPRCPTGSCTTGMAAYPQPPGKRWAKTATITTTRCPPNPPPDMCCPSPANSVNYDGSSGQACMPNWWSHSLHPPVNWEGTEKLGGKPGAGGRTHPEAIQSAPWWLKTSAPPLLELLLPGGTNPRLIVVGVLLSLAGQCSTLLHCNRDICQVVRK